LGEWDAVAAVSKRLRRGPEAQGTRSPRRRSRRCFKEIEAGSAVGRRCCRVPDAVAAVSKRLRRSPLASRFTWSAGRSRRCFKEIEADWGKVLQHHAGVDAVAAVSKRLRRLASAIPECSLNWTQSPLFQRD